MPMEIKRFNPKYDEGLTNEQVNQRIAENLTNINEQPQTKTIKQIIYSNIFCITMENSRYHVLLLLNCSFNKRISSNAR